MNVQEIDKILKHTLNDFRVSRGERRLVKQMLRELDVSGHELGILRSRAFEIAREAVPDGESAAVLDWLEEINKLFLEKPASADLRDDEVCFTPGDDGPQRLAGLFNSVRRRADVCVFTITDDRIANAILDAHNRKVDVRILSDNEKAFDPGSDIRRLKNLGLAVRVDRSEYHMHHKFALFDNAVTVTGSYNWTRSAARHNTENFIVSHNLHLAQRFAAEFERLWNSAE